jgi:hypothetical protein
MLTGEPYTEQERLSYVKHGIISTRYGKVVEPGVRSEFGSPHTVVCFAQ